MTQKSHVTRIADGVYRVEHEGRSETVYVAGTAADSWAFWDGLVFRGNAGAATPRARSAAHGQGAQALAAPMPATVIKVLATVGASVKKGDTLVVLEAMKMELPIRATGDAVVTAVRCSEGDLVQADAVLVELQ